MAGYTMTGLISTKEVLWRNIEAPSLDIVQGQVDHYTKPPEQPDFVDVAGRIVINPEEA